jgi:hypothetical protein
MSTASDRLRLLALLALATLEGCRNAPAESALITARREHNASDAASDRDASAPVIAQPTPPRAQPDLEIVGPITTPPGATELEVTRALRELIVWSRACIGSLDDGATIAATITFERGAPQRPQVTVEPADTGVRDCVRTAINALHIRGDAPSVEGSARYRVVRRPGGALLDPSRICERDDDCLFVRGTCLAPAPVHRAHAAAVHQSYTDAAARRRCDNSAATPAEVRCVEHQCVGSALPRPEWRACAQRSECAALLDASGRFNAVSRSKSREAIAASPGSRLATAADSPPRMECEYHFCVLRWGAPQ